MKRALSQLLGGLDSCGQIFAARKLRSDRPHNFFDRGIRFHRPLLSFCCFCFGQANAFFDRGQSFVFVRELSPSDIEIGLSPCKRGRQFLHLHFRLLLCNFGTFGSGLRAFQLFDD